MMRNTLPPLASNDLLCGGPHLSALRISAPLKNRGDGINATVDDSPEKNSIENCSEHNFSCVIATWPKNQPAGHENDPHSSRVNSSAD